MNYSTMPTRPAFDANVLAADIPLNPIIVVSWQALPSPRSWDVRLANISKDALRREQFRCVDYWILPEGGQ